jgi:hypothetical protein
LKVEDLALSIQKSERSPEAAKTALSWRKPLKGARPVPGPIISRGAIGSAGSLKVDLRKKAGILSPFLLL